MKLIDLSETSFNEMYKISNNFNNFINKQYICNRMLYHFYKSVSLKQSLCSRYPVYFFLIVY